MDMKPGLPRNSGRVATRKESFSIFSSQLRQVALAVLAYSIRYGRSFSSSLSLSEGAIRNNESLLSSFEDVPLFFDGFGLPLRTGFRGPIFWKNLVDVDCT